MGQVLESVMGKSFSILLAALLISSPAWAIRISAVGDIMMGSTYPDSSSLIERDFFREVRPFFSASDVRIGNLEGTLFDGDIQTDGKRGGANRYLFKTPTRLAPHLTEAGFNFLSLANNHSRDFGRAGLESTKRTLSENGIGFSSKDGEVSEINIDGQKVAVISADFYQGKRSITTPASLYAEIRSLSNRYDIVIVMVHSGAEGMGAEKTRNNKEMFLGENRGNSVEFAHSAISAGADLILMSGPHVPRGLEVYNERLIAYSLGNFLTERGISISGYQGLAPLLEAELDSTGRFLSGNIHSFQQIRGRPVSIDPKARAYRLMSRMSAEDFPGTAPVFSADGRSIRPSHSPSAIGTESDLLPIYRP